MFDYFARILARQMAQELTLVLQDLIEEAVTRQDERLYKRSVRATPIPVQAPTEAAIPDYPGKPMKRS